MNADTRRDNLNNRISPLGSSLQGWPQPIICLHLSPPSSSTSLTLGNILSINLLSALPPACKFQLQHPSCDTFTVSPLYMSEPPEARPPVSAFTFRTSTVSHTDPLYLCSLCTLTFPLSSLSQGIITTKCLELYVKLQFYSVFERLQALSNMDTLWNSVTYRCAI